MVGVLLAGVMAGLSGSPAGAASHAGLPPTGSLVMGTQVPTAPELAHASHWPTHGLLQQTPSTQNGFSHSLLSVQVSPFFFADMIKLPLLIMHGADDANPGTTPLQSVKLYEAIRGNGGTARLVMLPHEPHWYSAMESNEQLAYEELRWFDKYVKNAGARK